MKIDLTLTVLSLTLISPAVTAGGNECGLQTQKLLASDQVEGGQFGQSCAIDDQFAVVGEPRDDESGQFSGAAHVYSASSEGWIHHSKLTASDGDAWDFFGEAVEIQDNIMAITAIGENANNPEVGRGAVYIFTYDENEDTWIEQQKLIAPTPISHDFGRSLSIDGHRMAIGAPLSGEACPDNPNGCASGSAFVYVNDGGIWEQKSQIFASDAEQFARFGRRISLSGSTIIVGVRGLDDPPDAFVIGYIFEQVADEWVEITQLTTEQDWDQLLSTLSTYVALDGDTAMVGLLHVVESDKVPGNTETSETFIYRRNDEGVWEIEQVIPIENPVEGGPISGFGGSLDLHGDSAVIGADGASVGVFRAGAAYFYTRTDGVWTLQSTLLPDDLAQDDVFGFSVALDQSRAIVGSIWDDDACLPHENPDCNSGSAYIFDISGCLDPAGDLNDDGIVDGEDLGLLLGAWGACESDGGRNCPADLNNDGSVNGSDLGILLADWSG